MKYFLVEALFPFVDTGEVKKRPVLILTQPNSKFNSVIVAFVTSKIPVALLPSDLTIDPNNESGLLKKSVIRLHKLTTLEPENLNEIIGELNLDTSINIKQKLLNLLDLT